MAPLDRFFYYPNTKRYNEPADLGLACEDVQFESGDGTALHAWFAPADGTPSGTIVHCHGNAGNVTAHMPFVAWLPPRGWNVLCFDYRGFGRSAGRPERRGTHADAHAAIDYVRTRSDVDPDRVALFGQSIGGTIGLTVATERDDLVGIVIDGAFSSYRREARFVLRRSILFGVAGILARWFISDEDSPIDAVGRLPAIPKLFLCGTADTIVDYRQTLDLHAAATDPKELYIQEDGQHCEAVVTEDDSARDRIADFLNRSVTASRAES